MAADPNDMQSLISSMGAVSADPEKMQALQHQMELAKMVRGMGQPAQGIQTRGDHGGVYVAPSALSTLGNDALQYVGYSKGQDAQDQMTKLAQNEQAARSQMLAAILRSQLAKGDQDSQSGLQNGDDGDALIQALGQQ